VANPIQRLRYFDGEYLRGYDFTDEQSYHIAMRRLMNLKLHLHGIVYGLQLVQDQDSTPGGPYFFSIAPGMAIDHGGREIVVAAPYSLSNVLDGPGLSPGRYEVWLCYQESQTGLPAAGYTDCDVANQNTRWQESFLVQLKALAGPTLFVDCGGVRVGIVNLVNGVLGLEITPPAYNTERGYIGIRAQRVIAANELSDTFDITAKSTPVPYDPLPGYLDVHPGLFERGNAVVQKNVVIGGDFLLDNSLPDSKNLPGNFPATGNLKVTADLFVKGDFYGYTNGSWYKLQDYIKSMMPNFVVGSFVINIPQGAGVTTQTVSTPVATTLARASSAQMLPSIAAIDWRSGKELKSFGTSTNPLQLSISAAMGSAPAVGNQWTFPVTWIVSPSVALGGGSDGLPITALTVSYLAIFTP
jgi:hypothetical protein